MLLRGFGCELLPGISGIQWPAYSDRVLLLKNRNHPSQQEHYRQPQQPQNNRLQIDMLEA